MELSAANPPHALPDHLRAPDLHAGFWLRFVAYLIDGLVLTPVFVLLYLFMLWPIMVQARHQPMPALHLGVLGGIWVASIVVPWLYYALCEASRWQATPGKLALGLRVTDEFGRPIGFGRASGRFFGKIVSGAIMDIGYMLAGWTARKQALHDLMAGCCVVRKSGLEALRDAAAHPDAVAVPQLRTGMPGWAVALVALGGVFFLIIPIFAILAAIAIPAYQNYLVRAEVAQGIQMTTRARARVAQYIGERGALPDGNAALGLPEPEAISGHHVESVRVVEGKVVVTFASNANAAIRGDHLVLSPSGSAAMLAWHCSSPDIRAGLLPSFCRR